MANIIFNKFLETTANRTYSWDTGTTIRAMLIRQVPGTINRTRTTVAQLISDGFVEITASGYSRQTVTNKQVYLNNTTHEAEYRGDNLNFGNIAVGQTVVGVLFFVRVGASDDANNDIPVAYIDETSDNSLPMPTGNGAFVVNAPSNGYFRLKQGT